MESSDSDDEEDRVSVRHRGQKDRLAREDDYIPFVTDLSEEDYILMDNYLFSPLGESTEEELWRRLHLMKENLPQNSDESTDRGDASDNESSENSLLDRLTTFGQTENVTSEQKENQSWREESEISANSDELRFGLESNLECDDENSNPENEYVASAELPRREDTEDSQRQVENPQSESLFTTASASEHDTMETLMEVPPTRSQRRLRSWSPVSRRTRPRTDNWSPPHTLWEFFQRINEDTPSQTFKQPLISENDNFSRTGHEETLRQQMPGHELQNRGLFETSEASNAVHGECYSDTTCSSESWEVRETNPTTPFNFEVEQVHCQACSQRDSRISRTQLTSGSPNNTTTSESEQEELKPMSSDSDEADESAYANTISNPVHRILNTSLSDTMSVPTQTILCQTMTGFSNSSNLMDSDSNLEYYISPLSENMERAESPNERHGPSGSDSIPGSAPNASYNFDSRLTLVSLSSPYYLSTSIFNPVYNFGLSDEDSEFGTLMLMVENSEERSSSTGLPETSQEGGRMSPITVDNSDSGSSLNMDQFFLLEADPHQTAGLTKLQINNLPLRFFEEKDAGKICTICLTEYTTGNMLRILPCTHEYHNQCIDQWLEEHSNCPICRGPVVDHFEADNFM
ncbi:E3 ubiquitin-protein ligase RLIM-like [Bubalus kerabau]|uniref:E3 ubiquitin-protein ligase RLIM-like n=1 Tax=Bubalus carabanensis TaxID=3119969 RepID=UPI00244EF11E|nr:E3 ubiquitin-protein ligase RLIM-like [Bubalus carabanensis]